MGRDVLRFARFAWFVLACNVAVILWGGYVRASGSGAGCGDHWPLCNGEVLPRAPQVQTLIELTHRITSGLALVLVAALVFSAFRAFPAGHRVRRWASLSAVFLLLEALLGAGLVLFRFVDRDASAGRAVYLCAHLVNTQVLLAMLAGTAWFASHVAKPLRERPRLYLAALPVAILLSVTGALAALGDTLFPATSITIGLRQDFEATSHALLRLRLLHPAVAIVCGTYLLYIVLQALKVPHLNVRGMLVGALLGIQCLAGAMNIVLLAPVWMQILHLLLADLLWIGLVLLYFSASHAPEPARPAAALQHL